MQFASWRLKALWKISAMRCLLHHLACRNATVSNQWHYVWNRYDVVLRGDAEPVFSQTYPHWFTVFPVLRSLLETTKKLFFWQSAAFTMALSVCTVFRGHLNFLPGAVCASDCWVTLCNPSCLELQLQRKLFSCLKCIIGEAVQISHGYRSWTETVPKTYTNLIRLQRRWRMHGEYKHCISAITT